MFQFRCRPQIPRNPLHQLCLRQVDHQPRLRRQAVCFLWYPCLVVEPHAELLDIKQSLCHASSSAAGLVSDEAGPAREVCCTCGAGDVVKVDPAAGSTFPESQRSGGLAAPGEAPVLGTGADAMASEGPLPPTSHFAAAAPPQSARCPSVAELEVAGE